MASVSAIELSEIVDAAGYGEGASIAVAVVNPDGSIERAERGVLTPSTRVYGASLTKQLVAMLLAQEFAAGRVDVDAPLSRWFPDFPAWANQVRVRHVIHHISGLPDEQTLDPHMPDRDRSRRTSDAMIAALRSLSTLPTQPGEAFAYSNIGYVLLGRILESSSGRPLPRLFAERIFAPLEMADSMLWDGPDLHPESSHPLDASFPTPHSLGDGGMWTTADDLTHWIQAMNDDRFDVIATTTVPGRLADGSAIDYAWGVNSVAVGCVKTYAHGGGWNGSISRMTWIPERKSGFIAFTVDGGDPLGTLSEQLTARLASDD